jgi:hypothetical protein
MDALIARLVRDFENGEMNRQQLIQTLTMAAVAAPLASAIGQAGPAAAARGRSSRRAGRRAVRQTPAHHSLRARFSQHS